MSDVTTGKGFDSEFLTHPPRFFGRIVSKESWTGNIAAEQFDNISDLKGWGYRYKIRIFSWHTGDKNIIPDEQLVMANVVLPVTAGSGMGGAGMTPSLEPGSVVTGFFMDGMGGQEPYIDGVLGNSNNNVPKEQGGTSPAEAKSSPTIPGNVDSLSASSLKKLLNPARTPSKEEFKAASLARQTAKAAGLSEEDVEKQVLLATVKASQSATSSASKVDQKNLGYVVFNNTYSDSSKFPALVPDNLIVDNVPLSTFDAVHITTFAWTEQDEDRKRKTALLSACKKKNSEVKGIQRTLKNAINDIEKLKKQTGSVNSKVQEIAGQVDSILNSASEEISRYVKIMLGGIRGYILDKVTDKIEEFTPFLYPSDEPELNKLKNEVTDGISCVFSKIISKLKDLIKKILEELVDKVINAALCVVENLLSEILNNIIGPIMDQVNSKLTPILELVGSITGTVSSINDIFGNVSEALDFKGTITKLFGCDGEAKCPNYDEVALGDPVGSSKPGGDAKPPSNGDPTGTGGGNTTSPVSANITSKTQPLEGEEIVNAYTIKNIRDLL